MKRLQKVAESGERAPFIQKQFIDKIFILSPFMNIKLHRIFSRSNCFVFSILKIINWYLCNNNYWNIKAFWKMKNLKLVYRHVCPYSDFFILHNKYCDSFESCYSYTWTVYHSIRTWGIQNYPIQFVFGIWTKSTTDLKIQCNAV